MESFEHNNRLQGTLRVCKQNYKQLEDLKVLRRSPDLLNNVKIGKGQLQLIMEQILFYRIWGLQTFWSSDLSNLMNNPSNSPVISEKQMFREVCGSPNEWPSIKGHRSAWHLVLNIRFFPNKCIRNQVWPCHKVGQGQPRLIICANLVGPTSPMLHTKSQGHWPFGSREEDI